MYEDNTTLFIEPYLLPDIAVKSISVKKSRYIVSNGHLVAVFDLLGNEDDRNDENECIERSRCGRQVFVHDRGPY